MTGLLLRRILSAIPLTWGVLTLVFLLVQIVPGEPFQQVEGARGGGEVAGERLREIFGTDRPILERYARWLVRFSRGDLGTSISHRRPVGGLIREAVGRSLLLGATALLLQFALGAAAGIAAARARSRRADRAISGLAGSAYSLPSYVFGVLLAWLLSVRLGWLPASQMRSIDYPALAGADRLLDLARHLVLPCLALALPAAGGIALYVRDELAAAARRGFARAAAARGCGERRLLGHLGANAALPVLQLVGLAVPGLVGGSVVIEVLFAWPGMGRLAYQAVLARDEPLVLGCVFVGSLFVIAGSLLADVLSAWADPRVREAAG